MFLYPLLHIQADLFSKIEEDPSVTAIYKWVKVRYLTHNVSDALQCDALSLSRILTTQSFSSFLIKLEAKTVLIEACQPQVDFFCILERWFCQIFGQIAP